MSFVKNFLFLISVVLFGAFVYFSYLVSKELFTQFDFNTTVRIQNHISRSYDLPFSLISLLGHLEITGLVWFGLALFAFAKRWWKVLAAFTLFPASQAFELFGKLFLLHPSPPFMFFRSVLPFDFPSSHVQTDYSYPSGHTIRSSFLVVFLLFLIHTRIHGLIKYVLEAILVTFLILVWVSRVYLGEHWTTDVIGGAMLGISFGILAGIGIPQKQASQGEALRG